MPTSFVSSRPAMIVAEWSLRIALGLTLLSAVADRFGIWGPNGAPNVSWGDWIHFVRYCAMVNSFLPASWAEPLAWIATVLETVLGILLMTKLFSRAAAYGTALLTASFALAMTISFGVKAPLNFSVFADAAAALFLAAVLEQRQQA